jgi:nitrite reductase/ring-hydroxylating ferredoxin subunit
MSTAPAGFRSIARAGEIPDGGVKVVRIDEREIALFRRGAEYHAISNECTHEGGPLGEGILEDCVIECPWHGARFDVRTGAVLGMPATAAVRSFAVRIEGDDIQVELP